MQESESRSRDGCQNKRKKLKKENLGHIFGRTKVVFIHKKHKYKLQYNTIFSFIAF